MSYSHGFSVLASHSVKQPINPKTGKAFTTYERTQKPETTDGNQKNDQRRANGNAPLVGSGT